MNSHHNQRPMSLNLRSLRSRFALRFLGALKKIHLQEIKTCNNIVGCDFVGTNNNGNHNYKKYYKVKVAADASLATAVGPQRAWSRALLARAQLCWRRRAQSRREKIACRRRKRIKEGRTRTAESMGLSMSPSLSQGQGQTQELRSLVPGGEAMDLQNLLDETAHYIKCLTTQVNVMRSIVNCCSTN